MRPLAAIYALAALLVVAAGINSIVTPKLTFEECIGLESARAGKGLGFHKEHCYYTIQP
jgi:hypothetical protein